MGSVPALDDCKPGLRMMEFNVLIASEVVEGRTASGILLPDDVKTREQHAACKGRIVAVSPLAFSYDEWPDQRARPKVGDVVLHAKFAGTVAKGADEREYRIMKDKDIAAVVEVE